MIVSFQIFFPKEKTVKEVSISLKKKKLLLHSYQVKILYIKEWAQLQFIQFWYSQLIPK